MLHALLSDVHGNLEALDAVLADLATRGVTDVACLGDFVGYGASPNECVERLRGRVAVALLGNHDAAACDPAEADSFTPAAATAAHWTAGVLAPAHREWLRGLSRRAHWHGALLVHASPADTGSWPYVVDAYDAQVAFDACDDALVFAGHSHLPVVFERAGSALPTATHEALVRLRPDRRHLVVVPSVGQPRDHDPRAGYALWDDAACTVESVRVAYDVDAAQARIRSAGLPPRLADRLSHGT
ncbi:MAG: metallophosphoesterase family protein [bacterium]